LSFGKFALRRIPFQLPIAGARCHSNWCSESCAWFPQGKITGFLPELIFATSWVYCRFGLAAERSISDCSERAKGCLQKIPNTRWIHAFEKRQRLFKGDRTQHLFPMKNIHPENCFWIEYVPSVDHPWFYVSLLNLHPALVMAEVRPFL
jgi:hypothetical protein